MDRSNNTSVLADVFEDWRGDAARGGQDASSRAGYLASLEQPWLQDERTREGIGPVTASRPDQMLAEAVNAMSLSWFMRTVG